MSQIIWLLVRGHVLAHKYKCTTPVPSRLTLMPKIDPLTLLIIISTSVLLCVAHPSFEKGAHDWKRVDVDMKPGAVCAKTRQVVSLVGTIVLRSCLMLKNDVAKYTTWGFHVQSLESPMIKVADKFQFELLGPSRTIVQSRLRAPISS